MSDLAATNCGCGCEERCGCDNGCGCGNGCGTGLSNFGNGSCSCVLWIIILLFCCGGNNGYGNGCGNGCGNDSCCLIILILLLCGGFGGNGCGC